MGTFNRLLTAASLGLGILTFAGCAQHNSPSTQVSMTIQPGAVDLHNTVCPVTGEAVGESTLVATYEGKVYHFCCDGCPDQFKQSPDKFANAVAANPAKYGVKQPS